MEPTTNNPYVGPKAYTQHERALFFGRERESRELLSLVVAERVVLFYAQSGAGKTSLINARLVPRLAEKGFVVLPIGRVGGELLQEIKDIDNVFVFNLLLSLDKQLKEPKRFSHTSLADFLAHLTTDDGVRFYYDDTTPLPIDLSQVPPHVLIIDQFEEFFISYPHRWQDRAPFFQQLDQLLAADPLLWVVLTLREDYLAALDPYASLVAGRMRAGYYMRRMQIPATLEAVKMPAKQAGRPFEDDAATTLVDNLSQIRVPGTTATQSGQYVEPVQMQVVCYQLWENLQSEPPRLINLQDVERLGNVDRALGNFYEQALGATLANNPGLSEVTLRAWFEKNLITEARTRGTVYEGATQTGGLPNKVVLELVGRFLLRRELRAAGTWYELTHDRFVEPILTANHAWWEQSDLLLAVRSWAEGNKPRQVLYRGQKLKEALALQGRSSRDPLVVEFLQASQAYDAEEAAHEDRERKRDLSETGWGVIFAQDADPAIQEALRELLEHRQTQATHYYKELAYRHGETAWSFLTRHGVVPTDVDPSKVPYYLLIVGDPETIPFTFQYQLDVKYAVGRIHFNTLQEYAQYARSVVTVETQHLALPRRAIIFAPTHPDDRFTNLAQENLVVPVSSHLRKNFPNWEVSKVCGEDAGPLPDRASCVTDPSPTAAMGRDPAAVSCRICLSSWRGRGAFARGGVAVRGR